MYNINVIEIVQDSLECLLTQFQDQLCQGIRTPTECWTSDMWYTPLWVVSTAELEGINHWIYIPFKRTL